MRHHGLFVTGVGTGVGKTVVAGALAHLLKKNGYDVGIMKPVETGTSGSGGTSGSASTDLDFLRKMSGASDSDGECRPYSFKKSLSPYHAALAEKAEIKLTEIKKSFDSLKDRHNLVIVEGAGGLMVPLTENEFWPDLIKLLDLPVVIVTPLKLGMIHDTLTTVMAARMHGLEVAGIIAVEIDKKPHPKLNEEWLSAQAGAPLIGLLPYTASIKKKGTDFSRLRSHIEKKLNIKSLIDFIARKESKKLQQNLEKSDRENIWHPFTQMKEWQKEDMLIVESASGMKLKDFKGNSYYDGHSSYWVNIHGHSHPKLMGRLIGQSARLEHSTFLGLSNRPAIELGEKLVDISPTNLTKVFYSDNGSTAVEVGLKMAFQYFQQIDKPEPKRTRFVALEHAYHGDTLGAMAVGGVEMYRKIFSPLLPETIYVPAPYCYRCPLGKDYPACSLACASEMEGIIKKNRSEIAAFVIEPMVQCPGGIITAPHGYLKKVREVCDRYGILMVVDEVAVGFGRTGRMFACEHEEVQPDIMAISKGLAAGVMPLGATLASDKVYEAFLGDYDERKTFFHGHTFTGHPPACGVALESINLMEENNLIESLNEKAQFMRDELVRFEDLPHVGDIRQLGMIVGIELVENLDTRKPFEPSLRTGHKVTMEARRRGLIVRPLGDVVVLFPILACGMEDIREMLDILYESISAATGGYKKSA